MKLQLVQVLYFKLIDQTKSISYLQINLRILKNFILFATAYMKDIDLLTSGHFSTMFFYSQKHLYSTLLNFEDLSQRCLAFKTNEFNLSFSHNPQIYHSFNSQLIVLYIISTVYISGFCYEFFCYALNPKLIYI